MEKYGKLHAENNLSKESNQEPCSFEMAIIPSAVLPLASVLFLTDLSDNM